MFVRVKTLPHVTNDEQLDKALYAWFIQQKSTGKLISGESKHFSAQLNAELIHN